MYKHMFNLAVITCEAFITNFTTERFFLGVNSGMQFKINISNENLVTILTLKKFDGDRFQLEVSVKDTIVFIERVGSCP